MKKYLGLLLVIIFLISIAGTAGVVTAQKTAAAQTTPTSPITERNAQKVKQANQLLQKQQELMLKLQQLRDRQQQLSKQQLQLLQQEKILVRQLQQVDKQLTALGIGKTAFSPDRLTEMNQSFNQQYLGLQQQMQDESRRFTLLSNILKTKHDVAKNAIANLR